MTKLSSNNDSLLYLEPSDKKLVRQIALRSMIGSGTFNYGNMQGLVFLYAMIPAIDRYYENETDRIEAYKRHFVLFNTTPAVFGFVTGLAASMEKVASQEKDFEISSINSVKSSLMGPLAGIGDSIFWGVLKVVATGVGVSLAMEGSLLGPLMYFLINFIPGMMAKMWLPVISYKMGDKFFTEASKSGLIPLITKYINIIGITTIGAMATTMVKVNIPLEIELEGGTVAIQSVLDRILPYMLPVGLTLLMFKYLRKDVSPTLLIGILIVVSMILSFFKIM